MNSFTDLYGRLRRDGYPAVPAIQRQVGGQFEINLMHCDDCLRAADDAWLLQDAGSRALAAVTALPRALWRKPTRITPESGLHTHFSVLDKNGNNVLTTRPPKAPRTCATGLRACMNAMVGLRAGLSPHANSLTGFGTRLPTRPRAFHGAYEKPLPVDFRIPSGSHKARRIEHRCSGR